MFHVAPQSPNHRESARNREGNYLNRSKILVRRLVQFDIYKPDNCAEDQANRCTIWVARDRHHLCGIKSPSATNPGKRTNFECSYVGLGGGRNSCALLSLLFTWRLKTICPATCQSFSEHTS